MSSELMEKIVRKIDELPPMPSTILKAAELAKAPNASAKDLANVISLDQALTTKLLKWCNSPLYGLSNEVTSVAQAVALLGNNAVKNLAVACSSNQFFNQELEGYMIEKDDLWKHAIASASAAQIISSKKSPGVKDTAFTAGLLHDIGKIILSSYVKEGFGEIIKIVKEEKVPFTEAENRVLGFDHTEIGAKLAEKWKLPKDLVDAIRYHHNPSLLKEESKLVLIVHISNAIALMLGFGCGCDGLSCEIDENALKTLGIDEAQMDEMFLEVMDSTQEAEELIEKT